MAADCQFWGLVNTTHYLSIGCASGINAQPSRLCRYEHAASLACVMTSLIPRLLVINAATLFDDKQSSKATT